MDRYDPKFLAALVTIAKHLLGDAAANRRGAEQVLRTHFKTTNPEQEATPFLNHKFIWPAEIRLIVQYLNDPTTTFIPSASQQKALRRLIYTIGPSK